jgi:membrane protease YdiL (CAAX protease family)
MITAFSLILARCFLLLFLLRHDKNDAENDLSKRQLWGPNVVITVVGLKSVFDMILVLLKQYEPIRIILLKNFIIIDLAQLLILWVLLKFMFKIKFSSLGFEWNTFTRSACWLLFLAICISTLLVNLPVSDSVYTLIYSITTNTQITVTLCRHMVNASFYLDLFFMAPIVEEIVCRGILYTPYRRKYGAQIAAIFSGLFFFAFHLTFKPPMILWGYVFALIYNRTQSLIAAIGAHMVLNIFAFALKGGIPGT